MSDSKKAGMFLKITGPDGVSRDVTSDKDSVIVGSGESANVRVADPQVSSIHLMLKWESNGEVHAIDLGSEGGTRHRGNVIADPTPISSGDTVEIGGTRIAVSFGAAAAEALKVQPFSGAKGASAAVEKAARAGSQGGGKGGTILGGMRGRNASALFYEELPQEQKPTAKERALDIGMIWGDTIIEAAQFQSGSVTVGSAEGNSFKVYIEGVDKHVLATISGDKATINAPAGGSIVVRRGGKDEKAGSSATIGIEDRARIRLGAVEFVARFMKPDEKTKSGFFEGMDLYFTKILSIAVMIHIVILAALMITPISNELLAEDLFKNNARISQILLHPPEPPKPQLDLSGIEEGAKAKDDEGKFGKKEEEKKEADPSKKGAPVVDADKREEDRKKVLASGLLAGLGSDSDAASNIFGPGGLGTGINNALGGLQGGAGMGDAHGVGGLGSRGTGPGGGGTGLGLGGLGTKGGGRGRGGMGNIDLGGRGKATTRIIPGRTTVVGGLSKEVIGEVIRRHWNEIKYCYERELQKDPNLQGKVEVTFTIDGTGGVSEAAASQDTVGTNGAVGNCMVQRVRRWKFPEPKGGGQVLVNYPWVFRAAGTD